MAGESQNGEFANTTEPDVRKNAAVFEALAHRRRRYALACLEENTTPLALTNLAEEIAIREKEGPITAISNEETHAIATSLYHWHLPKLAEAGLIKYHREPNRVEEGESANRVHSSDATTITKGLQFDRAMDHLDLI